MDVVLVMFRADGKRKKFPMTQDEVTVGRREECDLRIPLGEVSRKHCRLAKSPAGLRVEDLGSSNGTYHNGRRIQKSVAEAGDTIQIGPVLFVVQIDHVPADDALKPTGPARKVAASEGPEYDALAPTAQSEVEEGEFDPLEVLMTNNEDSEFGAVVDDTSGRSGVEDGVEDMDVEDSQAGRRAQS